MNQLSDEEIMESVSNGNLRALTFIFERYNLRIYNFLNQMVNNREVSEDLTQNVFYKIIKYKHTYNGQKFAPWIFKIARNLFLNYYHEQKKTRAIELTEQNLTIIDEDSLEKEEDKIHLEKLINMLSNEDKELLIMNRINGIKYNEISEIVGSSPATIRVRVHRIINKLRINYLKTN